jgi:hypothetical protein
MRRYVPEARSRRFSFPGGKAPGQFYEEIDEGELLRGAIDVHIHAGPAALPRRLDGYELAIGARRRGIKAIVFKPNKEIVTVQMANLVGSLVPGIQVLGGVRLGYETGGFNPYAVRAAIDMGGRWVWMPVGDSAYSFAMQEQYGDRTFRYRDYFLPEKGLSALDENGELMSGIPEILEVIAEAGDVVLDLAHVSPTEALAITRAAKAAGVRKIITGHIATSALNYSLEEELELANLGVWIQYVADPFIAGSPKLKGGNIVAEHAERIRAVGPDRVIVGSDAGNPMAPEPWEGLRMFAMMMMWHGGFNYDEIELMLKKNAAQLIAVDS